MKKETIKRIIKEHDSLCLHAKKVFDKMRELDSECYGTGEVTDIEFDEKEALVTCDNHTMDSFTEAFYNIPLSYLSMTPKQLEKEVLKKKDERIKAQRKKFEEFKKRQLEKREDYERKQYIRLKQKFENK